MELPQYGLIRSCYILPGILPRKWALSGILGGIVTLVIWPVLKTGIPPLFAGLAVSGLSVVFGCSTVLINKEKVDRKG